MSKRTARIVDAALCLALFVGAWLSRACQSGAFVTWDEPAWTYRSAKFLLALLRGDPAGTMLVGHPGVITMWSGALSLGWHRFVTHAVSAEQLAAVAALPSFQVHDATTLRLLGALLPQAKGGILLFNAAVVAAIFLLARRLVGRRHGLAIALFLATDPYYLALSRVLHIDALTSGFMVLSVLGALNYARPGRRRYLVVSAVAAALAVLTKSYGVLAVPFAALLVALRPCGQAGKPPRWPERPRSLLGVEALWGAVALGAFVALWPAMWVTPLATLKAVLGLTFGYAADAGDATTHFFRGQFVNDPGSSFYPVAMFFRTTPLALLGGALGLLLLPFRNPGDGEAGKNRRIVTLAVAACGVLYLGAITLSAKKFDRYMLPALLCLDLLAGLGWAAACDLVQRRWGIMRAAFSALPALLALLQAVVLLAPLYPAYYLAYYNPLAGGLARAVATLPVGWGEGIESVARYLAAKPDARDLRVATGAVAGLAPDFPGQVAALSAEAISTADYVVLYLGDVQTASPLADLFYRKMQPEYVVTLGGVEYAWLYRNVFAEQLADEIAGLAEPGDVVLASVSLPLSPRWPGDLPCYQVTGTTESAVAEQLQAVAGSAAHAIYLDYADAPRAPGTFTRRQLAQTGLLLQTRAFAGGTLYHYQLPARHRFAQVTATQRPAVEIGGRLVLDGFGLSSEQVEYRQELGVGLRFHALQRMDEDYHVSLRLVDEAGRLWGQRDQPLEDEALRRTSNWAPESSHLVCSTVPLAAGIPPGHYSLTLGVYRLADLSPLPFVGPKGSANEFRLGTIEVTSATVPATPEELAIQHPGVQKLGGAVQLLGYGLGSESATSGEHTDVTLFWRCLQPLGERYRLELRLVLDGETVTSGQFDPAGPGHPTERWLAGEVLCWTQRLAIPAEAPTGDYDLYLNLYSAPGHQALAAQDLLLGSLHVEHRERLMEAPPIQFPFPATLGDQIELLGYELPSTTVRPGDTLRLTLYWRALRRPDAAYTVFTHLLDAAGSVRGQQDSVPAAGGRPTTGWIAGEVIVDPYEVPVNAGAQPGTYRIEIGFYDPQTGRRLPVTTGGRPAGEDRVLLPAQVTVR